MTKINFITSNKAKLKSLETLFDLYDINTTIISQNLNILEPQFDTVAEVSKYKAFEAFNTLKKPVVVEDGGMCVDALKGFPGVYTKYALTTIGAQGIIDLMQNKTDRTARFVSVTTYINDEGKDFQFIRSGGEFEIAPKVVNVESPFAWSEFWKIIYFKEYNKTLCEFSKKEFNNYLEKSGENSSLQKFAKWYKCHCEER